jgi:Co/Zn/Cd efflux system component
MNSISAPLLAALVASDTTSLFVNIVILAVVLIVAFWIVGKMGAPDPIDTILRIVVGVIGLVWLLNLVGVLGGHPFVMYHR